MLTTKWRGSLVARSMILVGLILVSTFVGGSTTFAQDDAVCLREVRAIDTNGFGLPNPAGLACSFGANLFLLMGDAGQPQPGCPFG